MKAYELTFYAVYVLVIALALPMVAVFALT